MCSMQLTMEVLMCSIKYKDDHVYIVVLSQHYSTNLFHVLLALDLHFGSFAIFSRILHFPNRHRYSWNITANVLYNNKQC